VAKVRPEILFPLFAPVTSLPGLGPRLGVLVRKLAGERTSDLLWHLPSGVIDRRYAPLVAEAELGRIATLTLEVVAVTPGDNRRRRPWRIRCRDASGEIMLVFFHAHGDHLARLLPIGATRVVSGRVESFNDQRQITHPDHVVTPAELDSVRTVEPVYPMTAGLPAKSLRRAIEAAVARAPRLPEWLDPALRERRGWPDWRSAAAAVHAPAEEADLDPARPARSRLAYDELLANQLALALVRARQRRVRGRPITGDGRLRAKALAALAYALTGAQRRALAEIDADLASDRRMLRLLQGDVGSGKTVVAALAMLTAVEAGMQAALMAPTEILARQHHATLAPLAEAAGVRVVLLTGREKGKAREQALALLADGGAAIVVGTHALFQDEVRFMALGVVVIDEQHRFGVHQRMLLGRKGSAVDVLLMTATPIPRTLLLTGYGDLDVSRLDEKPPGRRPIDTRLVPLARLDEVIEAVARAVEDDARVYWVCPLVEESEALDVAAAEDRRAALAGRFGDRVGLVHGRMKGAEKDSVLARFQAGDVRILVATTVIEVGVDVPSATVIVIEHAERFGLAQLHQLRGRVGRGARASTCLLLYAQPLGETAKARLTMLRESEDGFRIAEEDLRLRGGGEILGTRQSGVPSFRLADLAVHGELLPVARDDARLIVERDPELRSPRGEALTVLLYLFERDEAVRYVRSG